MVKLVVVVVRWERRFGRQVVLGGAVGRSPVIVPPPPPLMVITMIVEDEEALLITINIEDEKTLPPHSYHHIQSFPSNNENNNRCQCDLTITLVRFPLH